MPTARNRRWSARGFTLLEVLVALVIISLGMLAVFGQLNQAASTAIRLRDKTLAEWVAMDKVTELRLKSEFPAAGTQSDDAEMANVKWHLEVEVADTSAPDLRRADVTVSLPETSDRPLAKVTGFIARQPQTPAVAGPAGWEPLDPAATPAPGTTPGVTPPVVPPAGSTPPVTPPSGGARQ